MRINNSTYSDNTAVTQTMGTGLTEAALISPLATIKEASMQSAILSPAAAELDKLPEVDLGRVAEIKAALSRGEINFNASKLATLIERYHTGR
ncbi:uncharacterized protein NMK_1802 [Novimethylophilus kurashikiensis]|uniref:Negative regulator of flagellin synthesis n=1 Tax=Novimethylophilus kurashikiensis TaxID=1825523 RepID=A0A2R5F7R7_9PROT|nr:flagellar biosynthesis anti-sigma factor FlgM [Novimethylophilus kurashikiensis]GBG14237.1 uncharacterized protein NMK_1802 [Novimethylophilus kurashikiensis]